MLVVTQFLPTEICAAANRMGAMLESLSAVFALEVIGLQPIYPTPKLSTARQFQLLDKLERVMLG